MRRASTRCPRPARDQILEPQPRQQIATDVLAKNVLQPCPINRLVIGDGAEHAHLHLSKGQGLIPKISSRFDRLGELGPRAEHPAIGYLR